MRYFNLRLFFLLLLTAGSVHAQEPVSSDHFAQRGINRFKKNDFEGAIADFTKAIELNAQQQEFCFYFRGIALYRRGRLDEAIADLSKAISLKQHPRFYGDRGNLLAQKGDFDSAIADLNKAIELEPKFAKAFGDRGIVHLMRGEDAAADTDFEKCFELDKSLETQFKSAAHQIKQQAVLRAEHQEAADVEIVKFSWEEEAVRVLKPSSPVATVTTTPVSQTGLRVLGDPTAKDQPGPPSLLSTTNSARRLRTPVQRQSPTFNGLTFSSAPNRAKPLFTSSPARSISHPARKKHYAIKFHRASYQQFKPKPALRKIASY